MVGGFYDDIFKEVLARFGLIGSIVLCACSDPFDYSIFESNVAARHLTEAHLNKLLANSNLSFEPFRFSVTADSHYYYADLNGWVDSVNNRKLTDFSLILGDIIEIGLQEEYLWVVQCLERLNHPFLTVIGNHGAINNGQIIYQKLFGPLNYSFVYNNVKFVMLDTSSWDFQEPGLELNWLQYELSDAALYQHTILISHINPISKVWPLLEAANVSLSASGHSHNDSIKTYYYANNQPLYVLTPGSVDRGSYYDIGVQEYSINLTKVIF